MQAAEGSDAAAAYGDWRCTVAITSVKMDVDSSNGSWGKCGGK